MNMLSMVKGMLLPIITKLATEAYKQGKEDHIKGDFDANDFKKKFKEKFKEKLATSGLK